MSKNLFYFFLIVLSTATISNMAAAQTPSPVQGGAQKQLSCQEEKTSLYNRFLSCHRCPVNEVYNLAKEYLQKFSDDDAEISAYLKKWIAKYENQERLFEFNTSFNKREFDKAFLIGKEILKDEPNNLHVLLFVSYAGFELVAVSHDCSYKPEAINYSKQALNLLNSNTTLTIFQFFKNRVGALAWMNFIVGYLNHKDEPREAIPYIYESVQDEPTLKWANTAYGALGRAYMSEYKKAESDSAISPNKKNAFLECAIDSFARAHVYSGDPHLKSMWLEELTDAYKKLYGNNATGLSDYIKQIKNKPMCKLE